jgi:hypothetical protein
MTMDIHVKTKSRNLVTLLLCLLAAPAVWAEPDALFIEATRLLAHEHPVYAYTLRTTGSEEVLLETFDPSLEADAQWQLLEINDAAPGADRLDQYREQKQRELEEKPRKKFKDVVGLGSLHRVAENTREVLYEFEPNLFDDKPELNEKFVGKIVITKSDQRIRQMEFRNTGKINPAPAMVLEKVYTLVNFMTLADGQPVAKIILIHTQGIAFESEKFDEQVTQEYSDYRRVIPETPAAEAGADNGAESGSDSSANTGALSEAVVEEEEEQQL